MNREMRRNPRLFPILGLATTLTLLAGMATAVLFGPAAYDTLGMLRKVSDGVLSGAGTVNNTGVLVDSIGVGGNATSAFIRIVVPSATGTSPTLDITIQDSPDNSTWKTRYTFDQITAAGTYRGSFATKQKYVRSVTVAGGTTPAFGLVQIGLETGSEYRG